MLEQDASRYSQIAEDSTIRITSDKPNILLPGFSPTSLFNIFELLLLARRANCLELELDLI